LYQYALMGDVYFRYLLRKNRPSIGILNIGEEETKGTEFIKEAHQLLSKSRLHFLIITSDISENSRAEILSEFSHYPIVQHYTSADLEKHFGIKGAKVVGFKKSGLAQSIYSQLKPHRINKPAR